MGSANEMVVHLEIAKRLNYVEEQIAEQLKNEYRVVGKMLNRLMQFWDKNKNSSI